MLLSKKAGRCTVAVNNEVKTIIMEETYHNNQSVVTFRSHVHQEQFVATAERLFELLITPSAIRFWWGASRAIIVPRKGGTWTAAWGDEDDPDYVSAAKLVEFDRPRGLTMKHGTYYAKSGPPPFDFADDAMTRFTIEPLKEECILKVEQTGFPSNPIADDFYVSCGEGWKKTFEGIRRFLKTV